jgi:hypothetical protein
MRMRWGHRASGLAWVIAGWLAGCGPLVLPEGATETDASEDGSTTAPPPPSTTTSPPPPSTTTSPPPPATSGDPTSSDVSTSDDSVTSSVFLPYPDGGITRECDFWEQDCPRGEKCMPWANDGGNVWNALRCSPIADDPDAVGEPCTVEGSGVSGIDSCEAGSMCWDVDPETLQGYCVGFCTGSPDDPMCEDPYQSCALGSDGPLALCFPLCDPLLQDCAEGQACYGIDDVFNCIPDASGEMGAPGDECEYLNVCDPGTFCASAELVPGCPGMVGCCTPFCDVNEVPPACLPGQECTPWYEVGEAPPGYENVGACVLPM